MNSPLFVQISSLLTGVTLGIDSISGVFLSFTFFIWLVSGLYAYFYMKGQKNISRFFLFYIITASGNIGLILAQDMVSFYLFFAVMTFAAYPLIVHNETAEARYAGKVYIIMAVLGEAMLISAIMMTSAEAESTAFKDVAAAILLSGNQNIIIGLILIGFGIKAGAVFFHMWLPLAHPVAPTPASAVLSGVMIKAGLLGWIRFLPLGEIGLPGWGGLCLAAGLIAAFYGVFVGTVQDNPKTVLAYSSISQMGIMTSGLGIGLSSPDLWPIILTALLVYSMHHALNKAALFLGTGVIERCKLSSRRAAFFFLLLPSLSLAGAPFTSGYISKAAFKNFLTMNDGFADSLLMLMLPITSVFTTILMLRFLMLVFNKARVEKSSGAAGLWFSWLVLLICAAAAWLLPFGGAGEQAGKVHSVKDIFSALRPVFAGAIVFLTALQLLKKRTVIKIPPGDILKPVVIFLIWLNARQKEHISAALEKWKSRLSLRSPVFFSKIFGPDPVNHIEHNLSLLSVTGIVFILLAVVLYAILYIVV